MATASTPADTAGEVIQLNEREIQADSLLQIMVRRFLKHRMAVFGVILLLGIILYVSVGSIFYSEDYSNETDIRNRLSAPTADHIFGTDEAGRDVFARTIYGGQISIMIALTSVTISITLGTVIGLVAGFFGGILDAVLMRIVEALLAIPALILLLVLSRTLQEQTGQATVEIFGRELSATVVYIVLIIGLTSWMGLSRIVRSLVLSLKEQEFIMAARMIGAGNARIIFGHILPNTIAPVVVAATLGIGTAILIEAALSFLGFGVMPPTATWGNIINRARQDIDSLWWLWVFPGGLITLTVLSINFIGDGLRDALDPRSLK